MNHRYSILFILLILIFTACAGPKYQVGPGYATAVLKRVLLLPVTGVSAEQSALMTSVIAEELARAGHFEVVPYQIGQHPEFDKTLELARLIKGAIPMDMLAEIGRASRVDGVVVPHRSTIEPGTGVTYRLESDTGAAIKARGWPPRWPEGVHPNDGFKPVIVKFPAGGFNTKLFEMPSGQQLWAVWRKIKDVDDLRKLIRAAPEPGKKK